MCYNIYRWISPPGISKYIIWRFVIMEDIKAIFELANNGDTVAQYKLGRAYESGDGVEKNLETAIQWYSIAASNGYKNAEVKLKLLTSQQQSAETKTQGASAGAYVPPQTTYTPPAAPTVISATTNAPAGAPVGGVSDKSKLVAALLALFLGYFGAHDFYLGFKKQGIIKIVLTLSVIGSFIAYVLTLIDFIKILCGGKLDSDGKLLK